MARKQIIYLYLLQELQIMVWGLLKAKDPRIWNTLPNSIKNMTSLHDFLKELKVYYISEYG